MMRRNLLTARGRRRRTAGALILTAISSLLLTAGSAQAVVIDTGSTGTTVPYNLLSQANYVGLRLLPTGNQLNKLAALGIPTVTSSAPCTDPALTSDFTLPLTGLCWHGGPVIRQNETFSFSWDPNPKNDYTAPYVEQFLRDVADSSLSPIGADPLGPPLNSPFAVTSQYTDGAGGRALNNSLFSGGVQDTNAYPTQYPVNPASCQASGPYYYAKIGNGWATLTNNVCLTDAQIQAELKALVIQNGIVGHTQPGYTPLLILQTPPGVEVCLDSTGRVCSANGDPSQVFPTSGSPQVPAQFCSYHSQVNVPGQGMFAYVVQPFTAGTGPTACDEPTSPAIPNPVDAKTLMDDMGARLVSPLSQSMIAALVNPSFNGWFALNGSEIYDNRCLPQSGDLDRVTLGTNGYLLQREFNNGGLLTDDPFAFQCTPTVTLQPNFVVPSPINQGDVIEFDGSKPRSMLMVPSANFKWDFGDGTTATGPSQVHSYAKGGTYNVKLTVTDRGNNAATVTQPVTVLGPDGKPVPPPAPPTKPTTTPRLTIRLQLVPQSLKTMLNSGISIRVTSNLKAAGIVTLSIPRGAALKAHIKAGRGAAVMIGRGTVSSINPPMMSLRLKLAKTTVAKLKSLSHLTMTVRLSLVAATGDRQAVVAAARY